MSTLQPAAALGGLGRRTTAFLVDVSIEVTVVLPVGIGIGNFSAFESSPMQASPGKWLLGMRVTDFDGRRISLLRASGRYLGKGLSAMLLFWGFVMIAFHRHKQGLHDMLARTLVMRGRVKVAPGIEAPSPSPLRP